MDSYATFREQVAEAAARFAALPHDGPVRLISNYDADGISAAAILIHALQREGISFTVSIIQQLTEELLQQYAHEPHAVFLFADLGSKHLAQMHALMPEKRIFVLDHHELPPAWEFPNIILVSPHLFGLDGGLEISASGISFFFAYALDPKNIVMAPYALVGAIGDVQEHNGFKPLNSTILEMAMGVGLLEVRKGLRCFGTQTRPIHKILEYSTDPYIPGVTGSESAAIEFLHSIGVEPKMGKEWKRLTDLSQTEMENLITGIILRRMGEHSPEDILGNNYVLLREEPNSPFRDAKEFATLLNACGRMDKAALGLGACLGDPVSKRKAAAHMLQYKKAIVVAMNWFRENKGKGIIERDGYVIVNAGENFMSSIIGTMLSIIGRSGEYPDGTFLLGLARASPQVTKVSIRVAGLRPIEGIALHEIVNEIVKIAGGEAGGHAMAAGAMIPAENEEEFIRAAEEVLTGRCALIGRNT